MLSDFYNIVYPYERIDETEENKNFHYFVVNMLLHRNFCNGTLSKL